MLFACFDLSNGGLLIVLSHSVADLRSMASRSSTRLDVVEASCSELSKQNNLVQSIIIYYYAFCRCQSEGR